MAEKPTSPSRQSIIRSPVSAVSEVITHKLDPNSPPRTIVLLHDWEEVEAEVHQQNGDSASERGGSIEAMGQKANQEPHSVISGGQKFGRGEKSISTCGSSENSSKGVAHKLDLADKTTMKPDTNSGSCTNRREHGPPETVIVLCHEIDEFDRKECGSVSGDTAQTIRPPLNLRGDSLANEIRARTLELNDESLSQKADPRGSASLGGSIPISAILSTSCGREQNSRHDPPAERAHRLSRKRAVDADESSTGRRYGGSPDRSVAESRRDAPSVTSVDSNSRQDAPSEKDESLSPLRKDAPSLNSSGSDFRKDAPSEKKSHARTENLEELFPEAHQETVDGDPREDAPTSGPVEILIVDSREDAPSLKALMTKSLDSREDAPTRNPAEIFALDSREDAPSLKTSMSKSLDSKEDAPEANAPWLVDAPESKSPRISHENSAERVGSGEEPPPRGYYDPEKEGMSCKKDVTIEKKKEGLASIVDCATDNSSCRTPRQERSTTATLDQSAPSPVAKAPIPKDAPSVFVTASESKEVTPEISAKVSFAESAKECKDATTGDTQEYATGESNRDSVLEATGLASSPARHAQVSFLNATYNTSSSKDASSSKSSMLKTASSSKPPTASTSKRSTSSISSAMKTASLSSANSMRKTSIAETVELPASFSNSNSTRKSSPAQSQEMSSNVPGEKSSSHSVKAEDAFLSHQDQKAIKAKASYSSQDITILTSESLRNDDSNVLTLEIPTNFDLRDEQSLRQLILAAQSGTPSSIGIDTAQRINRGMPSPGMSSAGLPSLGNTTDNAERSVAGSARGGGSRSSGAGGNGGSVAGGGSAGRGGRVGVSGNGGSADGAGAALAATVTVTATATLRSRSRITPEMAGRQRRNGVGSNARRQPPRIPPAPDREQTRRASSGINSNLQLSPVRSLYAQSKDQISVSSLSGIDDVKHGEAFQIDNYSPLNMPMPPSYDAASVVQTLTTAQVKKHNHQHHYYDGRKGAHHRHLEEEDDRQMRQLEPVVISMLTPRHPPSWEASFGDHTDDQEQVVDCRNVHYDKDEDLHTVHHQPEVIDMIPTPTSYGASQRSSMILDDQERFSVAQEDQDLRPATIGIAMPLLSSSSPDQHSETMMHFFHQQATSEADLSQRSGLKAKHRGDAQHHKKERRMKEPEVIDLSARTEFDEELGSTSSSIARSVTSETLNALLARIDETRAQLEATTCERINRHEPTEVAEAQSHLRDLIVSLAQAAEEMQQLDTPNHRNF